MLFRGRQSIARVLSIKSLFRESDLLSRVMESKFQVLALLCRFQFVGIAARSCMLYRDRSRIFFRAKRKKIRAPLMHSQKRRGQNTTPANHQKTRDPTPTPTEKGGAPDHEAPHMAEEITTTAEPKHEPAQSRNRRRESPKTCTVHMKAKRPKRLVSETL